MTTDTLTTDLALSPLCTCKVMTILVICFVFLGIFSSYILYQKSKKERKNKRLKAKVLQLQNDLIEAQKELEDLKKEKNKSLDPISSQDTKSIFLCMDRYGVLTSVNDYACEFYGYEESELIGKNAAQTIIPEKDSQGHVLGDLIQRIKNSPRLYVDYENENICKDGRRVWISWTNRIIYDKEGNPVEIRSVGFDITPRKQMEEDLRQMTIIDPVTGVSNRHQFLSDCDKEMRRARRYGRDLSVLLMTIDRFESLNSEHGSAFGDEAIRVAVEACEKATRDSDYIGRLADIEFAILLPETPLEGAKIVAERIKDSVMHSNLMVDNMKINVTTSISVETRKESDETMDSVLLRAFNLLRSSTDRHNTIAIPEE